MPLKREAHLREAHLLAQLTSPDLAIAGAAYTILYNAHWPRLLRSAVNCGRIHDVPRAICEEIAHDAIAQLWFERATLISPPIGGYLRSITKRRILNARRNAQSEDRFLPEHYARCGYTPAYDEQGNLLWSGPFADARALRMEVFESFARAVDPMTVQRRTAVTDNYCDEYTVAESADLRGVAINTVRNLRQAGRRAVVKAMQDDGHTVND